MYFETERIRKMRAKPLYMLIIVGLLLFSCESNNLSGTEETVSDIELISAIQKSSLRESIEVHQLPVASKRLLTGEFADYEPVQAVIAHDHGYEVIMDGYGQNYGESDIIYFNLDGRKLMGDPDAMHRWGKKHRKAIRCFDLVFPITLLMPDSSAITLDSAADRSLVRDWYVSNPEIKERPQHQFPFQVVMDDSLLTISDQDDLSSLKESCREYRRQHHDDRRGAKCFKFVLPVTFTMPDGSSLTVNEEEDFKHLRAWRDENPDAEEKPQLSFPVTIIYPDETEIEIASHEELVQARQECSDNRKPGRGGRNNRN